MTSSRACLVLVLAACLAGCGGDGPAQDDPQTTSSGSGGTTGVGCDPAMCAPYACDPQLHACYSVCETSDQCAAGYVCGAGFCQGVECTPETAESVCGGYSCVLGDCAEDCAAASCAQGYYCRGDTNTCVPLCLSRGDPVCAGYVCDVEVGECEPICVAGELPCAAGYVCTPQDACEPDPSAPPCSQGCAPFACVTELGICAASCVEDDDCAPPATCQSGSCG